MNSILVATDLSASSEQALQRGFQLAQQLKIKLYAVHIVDDRYQGQVLQTLNSAAELRLQESIVQFARTYAGVQAEGQVLSGEAYQQLIQQAAQRDAELILLGMHRKTLLELFTGTTAERVARHNPGNTLLCKNAQINTYRRVLFVSDFSPSAEHALSAALRIAPDAEYVMAHFASMPGNILPSKQAEDAYWQQIKNTAIERLHNIADRYAGSLNASKVKYEVADEAPLDGIRRLAERDQIDLIVMGKHGRSALEVVVLGSVTRAVLTNPPCDVLVGSVGMS